jgi:hypothetical protein
MTPKEKAIELVDRFYDYVNCWGNDGNADYSLAKENARQCALIAVDEILNALSYKVSSNFEELKYYEEVKQEIEKL